MEFNQNVPSDDLFFSSYGEDWVEVAGVRYDEPVLLNFNEVEVLAQKEFGLASEADFSLALNEKPELIIVGCGQKQDFLHPRIVAYLAGHGIGVEVMTTPAACRTFNVLKSEGRKVWAWIWLK